MTHIIVGEWFKDKRHGAGCITFADGSSIAGIWKEGVLQPEKQRYTFAPHSKWTNTDF